jgi:hypothetical protein
MSADKVKMLLKSGTDEGICLACTVMDTFPLIEVIKIWEEMADCKTNPANLEYMLYTKVIGIDKPNITDMYYISKNWGVYVFNNNIFLLDPKKVKFLRDVKGFVELSSINQ